MSNNVDNPVRLDTYDFIDPNGSIDRDIVDATFVRQIVGTTSISVDKLKHQVKTIYENFRYMELRAYAHTFKCKPNVRPLVEMGVDPIVLEDFVSYVELVNKLIKINNTNKFNVVKQLPFLPFEIYRVYEFKAKKLMQIFGVDNAKDLNECLSSKHLKYSQLCVDIDNKELFSEFLRRNKVYYNKQNDLTKRYIRASFCEV